MGSLVDEERKKLLGTLGKLRRGKTVLEYRHLRVEIRSFALPNAFASVVTGWYYGIVERLFKKRHGWSIQIPLPQSLPFDLWMKSRWQALEEGDPLEQAFSYNAIDRHAVQQVFSGEVLDATLALDREYRLLITDEWLRLGPLPFRLSADDIATLLDKAVDLVEAVCEKALIDEDESAEDRDYYVPEPEGAYVTLVSIHDSLQAEFIQGLLARNGIPSQVIGTRMASLLGAAPHIFRLKILVPESQLESGQKILSQIQPIETGPEDQREEMTFKKQRAAAFGMSFFLPGAGNFYLMRPIVGLFIGLCILAGLFLAYLVQPARTGIFIMSFGIAADLISAQLAFSRMKTLGRQTYVRQVVEGLVCLAIVFLGTMVVEMMFGPPEGANTSGSFYLPFFYW